MEFLSGYHYLSSEKIYTAEAIFELEDKKSKNVGISNDLSTLATLAGIGSSAKGNTALLWNDLKVENLY